MEISNHRPPGETQTDSVSLLGEPPSSEVPPNVVQPDAAASDQKPPDEVVMNEESAPTTEAIGKMKASAEAVPDNESSDDMAANEDTTSDKIPSDEVETNTGASSKVHPDKRRVDAEAKIVYMSPRDLASSPFDDIVNPPATQEEWEALKQSAREFGILNPLIIWGNSGRCKTPVLAGNRRLTVALELGLESIPTISRDFGSKEAAKQFAIRENTERREMDAITRAKAADELWHLFGKAADKKAKAAEGLPPRKRAALAAGIAEGGLAMFRYVKESGIDDIVSAMLSGELAIHAAYKQAKSHVEGAPVTGGKSTGSIKTDKALEHLKAVSGFLKGLTKLSEQIATSIPNAAGRLKVADKKRLVKELGDAKDFIAKARNDDFLGALEKAIGTAESSIS